MFAHLYYLRGLLPTRAATVLIFQKNTIKGEEREAKSLGLSWILKGRVHDVGRGVGFCLERAVSCEGKKSGWITIDNRLKQTEQSIRQ